MSFIKDLLKMPGVSAAVAQLVPVLVGTGLVIVLWKYMMAPMLERSNLDWKTHQEIVEKQKEQCNTMERTSNTLKDTSLIQERIVDRLQRMVDK